MFKWILNSLFCGLCVGALSAQNLVERLGTNINSEHAETNIIIAPDGKSLYFSRKNHPQNRGDENLEDIWVSYNISPTEWSMAVNMGSPLNSVYPNAPIGISINGNYLFLKGLYSDTTNTILWQSQRESANRWQEPTPLSIPRLWTRKFSNNYQVSADGNTLLICNEGTLLAALRKEDGNFAQPRIMGMAINPSDENGRPLSTVFAATLAADNKRLFFAARRNGDEKIRLYWSQRLDDTWQEWTMPEVFDIAYSLTSDVSLSLPLAADWLYFTATDPETLQSDVFRVGLPSSVRSKPVALVQGQAGGKVKLNFKNLETNQLKVIESQEDGKFIALLQDWQNGVISALGKEKGEGTAFFTESYYFHLGGKNWNEIDADNAQSTPEENFLNNGDETKIEDLRLRLRGLDDEINQIETALVRQKTFEVPQEALPSISVSSETTTPKSVQTPTVSSGDATLDELRRKFKRNQPTPPTNNNADKISTEPIKYKPQNAVVIHSSSSKSVYIEDKDLIELRKKYNAWIGKNTPEEQPREATIPPSVPAPIMVGTALTREILEAEWETICHENMLLHLEDVRREIEKNLINSDEKRLLSVAFKEKQRTWQETLRKVNVAPIHPQLKETARQVLGQIAKKNYWKTTFKRQVELELAIANKQLLQKKWQNDLQQTLKQAERNREKRRQATIEESQQAIYAPSSTLPTEGSQVQNNEITLKKILPQIGQKWVLNGVFFEVNTAHLHPASFDELDRLIYFLQQNPYMNIEISAHTNSKCNFAQQLTQNRAETIVNYLKTNDIDINRLKIKAAGNTEPRNPNDSPQGLRNNQRIEIKIIR